MLPIAFLCRAGLLAAAVLCALDAALAQEPGAGSVQMPLPRGALIDPEAAAVLSDAATEHGEPGTAGFDASQAALAGGAAGPQALSPIPLGIIRSGFGAQDAMASSQQDRSVGVKLGQDIFSLSTTLTSPGTPGASRNASLGWRWAQPVSSGSGLVWGLSAAGTSAIGAAPEQSGDAVLGYRRQLLPHLTLTSQLGLNANYVFAPGDGLHSALTPEVKLNVDLAKAVDLPWQASVYLGLARKLPLIASDVQTTGTAMFSLKYQLP